MKGIATELRVKKAVILAGGQNTALAPLTNYCPTWMFPVLNKPIIEYTIDSLKKNGFEEIIISCSDGEMSDAFKQASASGITVTCHKDDRPRGTAGTLKDLEKSLEKEPFLVINGNLFIGHIDLAELIKFHCDTGSMITAGVFRDNRTNGACENVTITSHKTIKDFHMIHSSVERRSPWKPSGVYLFNPSVLSFIDQEKYMDIKEQLIPVLLRESLNVSAFEIKGFHNCINSMNDYITINRDLLMNGNNTGFGEKKEIAKGVWAGKDVVISPNAYLLGPLVIGDGCQIKDYAQIIGPTVIGNKCQISEGSLIRESILWDGASIANSSKVEYSVVGVNSCVPANLNIKNMIVLNGLRIGDANLIPSGYSIKSIVTLSNSGSITCSPQKIYRAVKRIIDIALSTTGIILSLPLFLLFAIAIKIDSPGPVFYIQRRCGKGGKLFNMIKFRTMITDAEKLKRELINKKENDGPMFKISNDPRITRLGRILRNSSFDEIPQLINVLKGEMSLVGPRPLIMNEMKLNPSWRDTRLKVKPGITGLWQTNGRSMTGFHDWIKHDVHYVKNQSLWLDIKILLKTIKVVIKRIGSC
jgi:lipopolysaccharide/colanic/teichoic acid biosynthesis glycosyltransferase/dTDP-glucose pyrophosphorylase